MIEAGWSPYGGGNRIVVDHGNGLKTTYNHLASFGISVGQVVIQSQQIAGPGLTGASTGCHPISDLSWGLLHGSWQVGWSRLPELQRMVKDPP